MQNDECRTQSEHRPLRVVIAGASGLVGRALTEFLTAGGHAVAALVRREVRDAGREITWDPGAERIDVAALERFGPDAAVNLSGENIAGRWTAARKQAIRDSRIRSTTLLAATLARLERRPDVLVNASAIGFYGDRGDEPLTEDSPAGDGFLPEVCVAWEQATSPAAEAGIRVVHLRIGVVLTPCGGALAKMLPAFRLGLGGVLGGGRQYMSWIGLEDLVRVIHFALLYGLCRGPINAVAPNPVTNREFTRTLGRVLRRPTFLPAPAFAIRLMLGEMGQRLLLEGQRVTPQRLLARGFEFRTPELEAALRHELQRP